MGKEALEASNLSRAQFFSFCFKKGLEAGANTLERIVDSYKEIGGELSDEDEGRWTELGTSVELSEAPKLIIRNTKGLLVFPGVKGKVEAYLAQCPEDQLLLHLDTRTSKVFCPFCQSEFPISKLIDSPSGQELLPKLQIKISEERIYVKI